MHAACWSHSRRKVFDAAKLNPDDLVATQLVSRIDQLFEIDAKARDAGMDHTARHVLRQEYSHLLVGVIKKEMGTERRLVKGCRTEPLGYGHPVRSFLCRCSVRASCR